MIFMVNSNPEKSKVEGILLISDFAASWGLGICWGHSSIKHLLLKVRDQQKSTVLGDS